MLKAGYCTTKVKHQESATDEDDNGFNWVSIKVASFVIISWNEALIHQQ